MKKIRQFLFRLIPACAIGAIIGIAAANWFDPAEQQPTSSFRTDHFTFQLYDGLTFDEVENLARSLETRHQSVLLTMQANKNNDASIHIWGNENRFQEQMKRSTGTTSPELRIYAPVQNTLCVLVSARALQTTSSVRFSKPSNNTEA